MVGEDAIVELEYPDFHIYQFPDKPFSMFAMDLSTCLRLINRTDEGHLRGTFGVEIISTYILARLLLATGHNVKAIGYPCIEIQRDGRLPLDLQSLQEIVFEQSDVDAMLLISNSQGLEHFYIQVVRYVHQPAASSEGLAQFLKEGKIQKYTADPKLCLLVLMEDAMSIDYHLLHRMLSDDIIPFGGIFLIGRNEGEPSSVFVGLKVHPQIAGPVYVDLTESPP